MLPGIWSKFKQGITIWSFAALPGIAAVGVVILVRLSASVQFLEWVTLDSFLCLRPGEPIHERVVIIARSFELSDSSIADG